MDTMSILGGAFLILIVLSYAAFWLVGFVLRTMIGFAVLVAIGPIVGLALLLLLR